MKATVVEHLVEGDGNHVVAVEAPEEGGPSYVADNGLYRAEFYQAGNRVVFQTQGRRVTYTPQAIRYVSEHGVEDTVYAAQEAPIEVKGPNVRFNRPFPDIDDQFTLTNDSLDHSILVQTFLREPSDALVGRVDFVTSGRLEFDPDLEVRSNGFLLEDTFETAEAIELVDETGHVIFTLPPVVAFDSGVPERARQEGRYRVTQNEPGMLAFDLLVDNEWMASTERRYPVVIDPSVIVSSAYLTGSNTGRKLVRLSNGYLVAVVKGTSSTTTAAALYWYVSKDGGATWSQLATTGTRTTINFAMASVGTMIYTILLDSAKVDLIKFDAATFPGGTVAVTSTVAPASQNGTTLQTAVGNGSIAVDSNGVLYVAWDAKIPAYSLAYNIRLAMSSDGGMTWGTPYSVVPINISGVNSTNPCVVLSSKNIPYIVYNLEDTETVNSPEYDHAIVVAHIQHYNADGTPIYDGNFIYTWMYCDYKNVQGSPSAVIDSNDVLHVVWSGLTTITNGPTSVKKEINYVKKPVASLDAGGGFSFTVVTNNTTYDQTNPSLMIDRYDRLWVVFQGRTSGSYDNIRLMSCTNGTWSSITDYPNSSTTVNAQYAATAWSKYNMNYDSTLHWIYMDGSSVRSEMVYLNVAPLAPTLTQAPNFDAATLQTLQWKFNDMPGDQQSSYDLEIYDITSASSPTTPIVSMTGSSDNTFALAPNTLTNGKTYQWRVRTYDLDGAVSPWSTYSTFKCSSVPQAAFNPPAAIASDSFTFVGSYSQDQGVPQQSFQFRLWDASGASLIEDSKTILGQTNMYTFSKLKNNGLYQIEFIVTSQDGLSSRSGLKAFHVSFTPPQDPTVSATHDPETTRVSVTWDNPVVITNLARNSDFETVNSTAIVMNDPLARLSAWTIASGALTTSSSGAMVTANGSRMASGTGNWQPIVGSNLQELELTAQATFTTASTLPAGNVAQLFLPTNTAMSAYYGVTFQANGTLSLQKKVTGVTVNIGTSSSVIPATNAAYTMTLSLDPSGNLTARLYSGTTATGVPLAVIVAADTALPGGFLVGVGADAGILISNVVVNAPFPDAWTTVQVASGTSIAITDDTQNGEQAISLHLQGATDELGIASQPLVAAPGSVYTLSAFAKGDQRGKLVLRFYDGNNVQIGADVQESFLPLANAYTRYSLTATAPAGTSTLQVLLKISAPYAGTVLFWDAVQVENTQTPSLYLHNDSLTEPISNHPIVVSNSLYRRKQGESDADWKLLTAQAVSPYVDYTCPAGHFEYGVCAFSATGAASNTGTAPVTVLFAGQWLIDENHPETGNVRFYYNNDGTSISMDDDVSYIKTFSPYLRERRGQVRSRTGKLDALFLATDGDVTEQIDLLDAMCTSEQTYLLKLSNGRLMRVRPSKLEYKSQYGTNASSVSLTWTEVGDV